MTISDSITVSPLGGKGSEISDAAFGINLVLGYERFGTLPWEKFDEVQSAIGSHEIRFPGGVESEALFDYASPNATSAVANDGSIKQLIATDAFLEYCTSTHTRATINLPVMQLLTIAKYGSRDFNADMTGGVRAYIAHVLDKAGPQGIATFELGNEYEAYMTSQEYGRVASHLALIAHQEIETYYAAHPGDAAFKPDVAVQVWGQSQGGTYSLSDLSARNHTVMAEFSAEEMAAITAVTSHFYYDEGANLGKPNVHTYANIDTSVGFSLSMMDDWNTASGRSLDTIFSEWNVNMGDAQNYGLQQVPVLLELFSSFVSGGVDQLDFWSTMYHATSLANFQGNLQAAGTLFEVMSQGLIGMKATDVPVASSDFDIHAFSGHGKAMIFVSSLLDQPIQLNLDLEKYLDHYNLASARLMQVDLAHADGTYKTTTGLAPWEEADAPILLTAQSIADDLTLSHFLSHLGAHETLVLTFDAAPTRMGSVRADNMLGQIAADRIDALGASDVIHGLAGDDTLFGGSGDDSLFGGAGGDRITGGDGNDEIFGNTGNDTLEGKRGSDAIHGGWGDDWLIGGNNSDTLTGDGGADGFVFQQGDWGTDLITDFSAAQGDFLVYDGASLHPADLQIEIRAVAGVGSAAPDLIVHFGAGGPALWTLQDGGGLTSLTVLDAATGTLLSLL